MSGTDSAERSSSILVNDATDLPQRARRGNAPDRHRHKCQQLQVVLLSIAKLCQSAAIIQ